MRPLQDVYREYKMTCIIGKERSKIEMLQNKQGRRGENMFFINEKELKSVEEFRYL